MRMVALLLGAATLLVAAPAAAATCQFSLAGTVTEQGDHAGAPILSTFSTDCSPIPSLVNDVNNNQYFQLNSVPGVYNGPGIGGNNGQGTGPIAKADLQFYSQASGGGLEANYPNDGSANGGFGLYSLEGQQLYSGTLAHPTFVPGTYTFTSDYDYGSVAATLSITQSAAPAAPEPASLAMMLLGFGAIGMTYRRRTARRVVHA